MIEISKVLADKNYVSIIGNFNGSLDSASPKITH